MKLFFCPSCSDVQKLLVGTIRTCSCGKSSGKYIDQINSEYYGDAVPLGFSNSSLIAALEERERAILDGKEAKMPLGIEFTAFTMPSGAPSVKMKDGVKKLFKKRPQTKEEQLYEFCQALEVKTNAHKNSLEPISETDWEQFGTDAIDKVWGRTCS